VLDPSLPDGSKIVLQRSLRSFAPLNASADTVRGSSKRINTLAFKNADLSFGADGSVTIEPRIVGYGLDAAYRQGLTSTPGIGRVIVSDGGPVETRPAGSSTFYDPFVEDLSSQVRSRYDYGIAATGDKVGFDFIGRRSNVGPVPPYSDIDNFAGFIDRRVFAPQTLLGYTILGDLPTGSPLFNVDVVGAGDRIHCTTPGNQFHDGVTSKTLLVNDLDLIHLPGYGVFVFHLPVGGVAADYFLRNLDGSIPSIPLVSVKDCSAYRPRFYTGRGFDGTSPINGAGGTWITGQGPKPALRILAGSAKVAGGPDEGGSTEALEFWYRGAERVPFMSNSFDTFGRFVTQLRPQQLPLLDKIHRGNFATRSVWDQVLAVDVFNVGHLVEDATGAVDYSYDFASLRAFSIAPLAFTVVAADRISVVGFPLNPLDLGIGATFFADLSGLTPTAPAENGLYVCQFVTTVGPAQEFTLRKLGAVSALTVADTGTVKFYTGSYLGKFTDAFASLTAPPITTSGLHTPSLVLGVAPDANAVALEMNGPEVATRPGANALQVNATDLYGTTYRAKRNLTIDFDGLVATRADYKYVPAKPRQVVIPMSSGEPNTAAGVAEWNYSPLAQKWFSRIASTSVSFSLRVPNDCSIVNVLVMVDPKNAEAVIANRMKVELYSVTYDFSTYPAPAAVFFPLGTECTDATSNSQTLNLSTSPNLGGGFGAPIVVGATDSATIEYHVTVYASATGGSIDEVSGVLLALTLNKTGPL
jgi:hypothetical protein